MNAGHGSAWRDVLTAVRARPGSFADVARRAGWSKDQTRKCLAALERAGCVRRFRDPADARRHLYEATSRQPPDALRVTTEAAAPWGSLDLAIFDALSKPQTCPQLARSLGSYLVAVRNRLYAMEHAGHVACDRSTKPNVWRLVGRPARLDLAERLSAMLDDEPRRALDLAATLRAPADKVRRALRELEAVGRAEPVGRGRSGATLWRAASPAR
jgi:DNA-binding IclR family transcriptional regulator